MRQIHFFLVVIANQVDGILQHGHHAETQQIDLDEAEIGAIVLIPLHNDAVRHGRRLQRNDRIELALADHHAARMLPQMSGKILNLQR